MLRVLHQENNMARIHTYLLYPVICIALGGLVGCGAVAPMSEAQVEKNLSIYGVVEAIEAVPAGGGSDGKPGYRVHVKLTNGSSMVLMHDHINDLVVGNRVHVVDGRAFRY
jgi:outer membrane lipoprotein SlyB